MEKFELEHFVLRLKTKQERILRNKIESKSNNQLSCPFFLRRFATIKKEL